MSLILLENKFLSLNSIHVRYSTISYSKEATVVTGKSRDRNRSDLCNSTRPRVQDLEDVTKESKAVVGIVEGRADSRDVPLGQTRST